MADRNIGGDVNVFGLVNNVRALGANRDRAYGAGGNVDALDLQVIPLNNEVFKRNFKDFMYEGVLLRPNEIFKSMSRINAGFRYVNKIRNFQNAHGDNTFHRNWINIFNSRAVYRQLIQFNDEEMLRNMWFDDPYLQRIQVDAMNPGNLVYNRFWSFMRTENNAVVLDDLINQIQLSYGWGKNFTERKVTDIFERMIHSSQYLYDQRFNNVCNANLADIQGGDYLQRFFAPGGLTNHMPVGYED